MKFGNLEDIDENLSLNTYIYQVRPYIKELIISLIDFNDTWKTQLIFKIIFTSFENADVEDSINFQNNFYFF